MNVPTHFRHAQVSYYNFLLHGLSKSFVFQEGLIIDKNNMILGIGIDIVKISRMDTMLMKWKDRFLKKVFTQREIDFCMGKKFPGQHFAIRFAAKEAYLKALGAGMMAGIPLKNIEIINDSRGKPSIVLHHKGKKTDPRHVKNVFLSLSHDEDYGVAQVLLEGHVESSDR